MLLNPPPHADHLVDVEVLARLEADRLGAVDDVKRPLPLGVARVAAELLAEHVAVGIDAVVEGPAADGRRRSVSVVVPPKRAAHRVFDATSGSFQSGAFSTSKYPTVTQIAYTFDRVVTRLPSRVIGWYIMYGIPLGVDRRLGDFLAEERDAAGFEGVVRVDGFDPQRIAVEWTPIGGSIDDAKAGFADVVDDAIAIIIHAGVAPGDWTVLACLATRTDS